LQEQQRHAALAAQLDEMRRFQRALRKQNPVVAENADRNTVNVGEAGDQRGAVERLELVELGAVDHLAPSASMLSRLTVASTEAACSPPITEMRAFGHMNRKRGP